MSQLFSKQANAVVPGTLPTTAAAQTVITLPSLTPPFGNCKGNIQGWASFTANASVASLKLDIRRNPAAENLLVGTATIDIGLGAAIAHGTVDVCAIDNVPDGRDCTYALVCTPTGGGGAVTAMVAYLEAELISG